MNNNGISPRERNYFALTRFGILFCIFALGTASLAQHGFDPIQPFNPKTMEECDRLGSQWAKRVRELSKRAQDCNSSVFEKCKKEIAPSGDVYAEPRCIQRESAKSSPAHTECGDVPFQFERCRQEEIDVACASKRAEEAFRKCQSDVNRNSRH